MCSRILLQLILCLLLAAQGGAALGDDCLKFVLCKHSTGTTAQGGLAALSGIDVTGVWATRQSHVIDIFETVEDKCTLLITARGSISVVGSAAEVAKRVFEGECK